MTTCFCFAFVRVTFGTATFSKELLFHSTYSPKFLLWCCSFSQEILSKLSIGSIKFLLRQYIFFQNCTCNCPFLQLVVSFDLKRRIASGHSFFNRTGIFWRISSSHPFFHAGWFFNRAVAAIHSFRGILNRKSLATVTDVLYWQVSLY